MAGANAGQDAVQRQNARIALGLCRQWPGQEKAEGGHDRQIKARAHCGFLAPWK
jgi:hypothetical protein